jgi:hypothetical protein
MTGENNEAQDYADEAETYTEEAVLNRWGKLKEWWSIGSTLVQVIKYAILGFKLLFLGGTAAVVVGQTMGEKPLDMVQEEVSRETPLMDEILNLQEDVAALEEQLENHQHNYPEPVSAVHEHDSRHTHDTTHSHEPAPRSETVPVHDHPVPVAEPHTHPEQQAAPAAISDALKNHIRKEH